MPQKDFGRSKIFEVEVEDQFGSIGVEWNLEEKNLIHGETENTPTPPHRQEYMVKRYFKRYYII